VLIFSKQEISELQTGQVWIKAFLPMLVFKRDYVFQNQYFLQIVLLSHTEIEPVAVSILDRSIY
jgi:hypothetical protein